MTIPVGSYGHRCTLTRRLGVEQFLKTGECTPGLSAGSGPVS